MEFVQSLFNLQFWINLFTGLTAPFTALANFLLNTLPRFVTTFTGGLQGVNGFMDSVISYFQNYQFGDLSKNIIDSLGNGLKNLGLNIIDGFKNAFSTIGEKIKDGFKALVIFDDNFWATLLNKIKEGIAGIFK